MNLASNITKNEHYIPQFYQESWECKERKKHIWSFDKSTCSIKMVAIKNNCSKDYLYEADENDPNNLFEKKHKVEYEDKYCGQFRNLLSSINCLMHASDSDKEMLIDIFLNFSSRHPYNLYNNPINNALVSRFSIGNIDKRVETRWLLNLLPFCNINDMNDYKVEILISKSSDLCFSDCITIDNQYGNIKFFPLTPNVVACFSKKTGCVDKCIRRINDEEKLKFLNMYIASDYVRKIYANNKDTIELVRNKYIFHKRYIEPVCKKYLGDIGVKINVK